MTARLYFNYIPPRCPLRFTRACDYVLRRIFGFVRWLDIYIIFLARVIVSMKLSTSVVGIFFLAESVS